MTLIPGMHGTNQPVREGTRAQPAPASYGNNSLGVSEEQYWRLQSQGYGLKPDQWQEAKSIGTARREQDRINRETGVGMKVIYGDPESGKPYITGGRWIPGNRLEGIDREVLEGMVSYGPRTDPHAPRVFTNQYGTFTADLGPNIDNPYGMNAMFEGKNKAGDPYSARAKYWGYIQQGPRPEQTYVPGWEATARYLGLPGYEGSPFGNMWEGSYGYGTPKDPWYGHPVGTNIYGWYGFPSGYRASMGGGY